MANGPEKAAFWRDFVMARCGFPNPARLAEQFDGAEFSDFCACGCNSFSVKTQPGVQPLMRKPRGGGLLLSADFALGPARQLEIILFADGSGNLARIDVMCNANSEPVPDVVVTGFEPFHVSTSKNLIV